MLRASEVELRKFILRRMPEDEASRLEEAIVLEDTVAERLRAVEFDLIDDYAADRLSPEDRADVERWLLTTVENRDTLRIALSLRRERSACAAPPIPSASKPRTAGFRVGTAGGLLAAGIVAAMLIPGRQPPRIAATTAPSTTTSSAVASAPDGAPPILTLLAETTRGASSARLHWPARLDSIRLQAEIPTASSSDASYRLQVRDVDGKTLFVSEALPAKVAGPYRFVDAIVPTFALGPGARTITVRSTVESPGALSLYTWLVQSALD